MRSTLLTAVVAAATAAVLAAPTTVADDRPSLTIAYPSVWKTHDGLDTANAAQPVVHNLYDRIIRRNWLSKDMSMENQLLPGLATSWKQVSDTEWHLKIRKGVRFHDGTPMTAQDVAFTVSPERTEMKPNAFIPTIKLTEAIDDETVRVVTKQPDPILLWRLATAVAYVVPKDYYIKMGAEGFGPNPIGTGPYKWAEKVDGSHIRLVANDDYWDGPVPLSEITFREVREVSGRVANLLTGQADIATSIPPDQTELVEEEDGFRIQTIVILNNHQINFSSVNTANVSSNKLIRQAMVLSLPRQLLIDRLWNGMTTVPEGYNWAEFGDLAADTTPRRYDPEAAKALLAEAGYDGEAIKIVYTSDYYLNMNRALQVAHEHWKAVGLNVELQGAADWGWWGDKINFDAYIVSADLDFNDPISPMWTRWGDPGGSYMKFWPAPEAYFAAGETLTTSLDREARKQAWQAMHDILMDLVPHIPFYRPAEMYGVRDCVQWEPYPLYYMDFRKENISVNCPD